MDTLGLIIKATRKCNLRCTYCHEWRSRHERMSFETLAKMTWEAMRQNEIPRVEFIWHGGEPLLLGRGFFSQAIRLQNEFRRPGQYVRNCLQTNGTMLTGEWCTFFADNNFDIGVSLDGPPVIHDETRSSVSGGATFDSVMRGIALLKQYRLRFGVLMVLGRASLALTPDELFDFFDCYGIQNFSLLAARPDNNPELSSSIRSEYTDSLEYCEYMTKMFDIWYNRNDKNIRIRELSSLLGALVGKQASVCTLAGSCIGQYFHVEACGDVYHCDKYLGDKAYHVGNIMRQSFKEIRNSLELQALQKAEDEKIALLKNCPFFSICHGGCPHDRYIAERYSPEYDGKCCGQYGLIDHMSRCVEREITAALG